MNSVPSCIAGHSAASEHGERDQDGGGLEPQGQADHRPVDPDQEPVHRVACSGMMRPRTNRIISAGTSVTDSSAAAAMAKVLV